MSAFSGRPSFSKWEIDLEKRRIALIDQLLADNGAMMINDLFRLVRTTDTSLFDKQSVLKSFIQSRTNIFQSDPELSTEICNRSMDYREAMLCIVDELADTSRQRNINFISSQLGLHYPTVKRCEIGLGVTADFEFVSEHKSILAFAGPAASKADQRLVGLHPLSQTIPSVWVNETLPEYDPSTWRWDYSFTISETARVVHSIKDSSHLKLEIVDNSPYAYDTVHVRGADVGLKNENLLEWFPLHSLVSFTAVKAYNTPQPWTAISIEEASQEDSAELEEQHSIVTSVKLLSLAPNSNQVTKSAANSSSILAMENMPAFTERDEKYLVDLIDSYVDSERLLIRSLWTHLQEESDVDWLLKDEAGLTQFLSWRPHLFFVDEGSVTLRSYSHRSILAYLINSMKSGVKYTLNSLGARIGSYDAEFKRDVYGIGVGWIQNFIDDHHTLLEVVGPYSRSKPLGQTVQLRKESPVAKVTPPASCAPILPAVSAPPVAVSNTTPAFIHGCGVIKKLDDLFSYLTIEGGEHADDIVYFGASELKYACGGSDKVGVGDHLNFDATNSHNIPVPRVWRATRLSLAVKKVEPSTESSNGVCSLGSPKTIQNQQATGGKESTEIKLETASTNPSSALVQRPSRDTILQLELSRKAMTDNYLEYGPLSVDALFEKFALTRQDFFSYHYQMIEFLCIRSHLYAVDFDAKSVTRRHMDYRRVLSKLLIGCCQRADCSVEDLRQLALQSNDNAYAPIIDQCTSKLAFENFLKEHEQLFEMSEVIDDKENRMVQARGTYDVIHDILLPRYYNVQS